MGSRPGRGSPIKVTAGTPVVSEIAGIIAQSDATGAVTVETSANAPVTVTSATFAANGIDVEGAISPVFAGSPPTSGDLTVHANAPIYVSGDESGPAGSIAIAATGFGTGKIFIETGVDADVKSTGAGIVAFALGGGDATVTTHAPVVATGGEAISLLGNGNGSVTSYDRLEGSTDGINLNVSKKGTIVTNAPVVGGGSGINGLADVLDVTANDTVTAPTGTLRATGSATDPVIFSDAVTGTDITINDGAVVRANDSSVSALAVVVAGGRAHVTNRGKLLGRVSPSDESDIIKNFSLLSWHLSGANSFGAGGDSIVNSGGIYAEGPVMGFAMGAGLDQVDNSGGSFFSTGATTFTDLETFTNTGGTLDMQYGAASTDTVAMAGAAYDGGAGGALKLDAELGPPGSTSDRLVIGTASGTTAITVHDAGPAVGTYNPSGAAVVDFTVAGDAAIGDFTLAGGPRTKGLFVYDLFLDPGNSRGSTGCAGSDDCFVLASDADKTTSSLPQFVSIAEDIWQTASDGWIARSGELRSIFGSADTPALAYGDDRATMIMSADGGMKNAGAWARVIGNGAEREASTTVTPFPGQPITFGAGHNQVLGRLEGGIDYGFAMGRGTAVLGVLGGYVADQVDFADAGGAATFRVPMIGFYADWIDGPAYVDTLFKTDFLTAGYTIAGVDGSTDIVSLGGRIEAGYRRRAGDAFFETIASLAYAQTRFSDITVAATPIAFNDGESLRGKFGLRLGMTAVSAGTVKIEPYITASVGEESLGRNSVFLNSGPGLTLTDDVSGVFKEVGAGINIARVVRDATVFAQAVYVIADGYRAGSGKAGLRLGW